MKINKSMVEEEIDIDEDIIIRQSTTFKKNINCKNIICVNGLWDIIARDIIAEDIIARDIIAEDIIARDIILEKRIKKDKDNKTIARVFIENKDKLEKKEQLNKNEIKK